MIGAKDNNSEPLNYQKEIRAMYVDPDFQRKGIGTMLLDRILSELKEQQARSAMLWCIKANAAACSFMKNTAEKNLKT